MVQHVAQLRSPADFGLAVQPARFARGLTQKELAAELDVSQSAISEIEAGKSTIYLRRLLSLPRLLGIDFSATWTDDR